MPAKTAREEFRKTIAMKKVMDILDCSDEFIRKELRRGKLEGIKIGTNSVRIYRDSLRRYMDARKILPDERVKEKGGILKENYV